MSERDSLSERCSAISAVTISLPSARDCRSRIAARRSPSEFSAIFWIASSAMTTLSLAAIFFSTVSMDLCWGFLKTTCMVSVLMAELFLVSS